MKLDCRYNGNQKMKEISKEQQIHEENGIQSKSELIERNLKYVIFYANKFENSKKCIEDLLSVGTIGLIKAANALYPNLIEFETHMEEYIEKEINSFICRG